MIVIIFFIDSDHSPIILVANISNIMFFVDLVNFIIIIVVSLWSPDIDIGTLLQA